jgi:hypothetical protein
MDDRHADPGSSAGGAARRAFVEAQAASLEPLGFVVVGLPRPPFDAIQLRHEEDGTFVVEIASRDTSAPFTDVQAKALGELGFVAGEPTWTGPVSASAADAVAVVERVLDEVLGVDAASPVDVRHGTMREERAAEAKLAEMRSFIEPVLASILGGTEAPKDGDGDYMVDVLGSRVFVAPRALPGRPPIIRVFAITNAGLNLTPDLGLFLARVNFSLAFGRFSIDTDHRAVWFDETLLGDHVTPDELTFVVNVVAETAAEWDEKIASLFGGTYREAGAAGQGDAAPPPTTPSKPGEGGYL